MLERDIERYLVKMVRLAGGRAYKFVSPSNRGVSDRIVFINKQIWFIELKRPGGKISRLQKLFADYVKPYTDNYRVFDNTLAIDKWLNQVSHKQ